MNYVSKIVLSEFPAESRILIGQQPSPIIQMIMVVILLFWLPANELDN